MKRFSAKLMNPLSFTPRETDILRLMCLGCSDKFIASLLNISPSTVSSHLRNVYQKLDVRQGRENVRGIVQCMMVAEGVVALDVSEGDRRHDGRDGDRRVKGSR
ncbi:MAG: response regulator transcription factor [Methylovulum sp.]